MPMNVGNPIVITNPQPVREVSELHVKFTRDADGTVRMTAQGVGVVLVRDAAGNVAFTNPGQVPIGTYTDAQIAGAPTIHSGLLAAYTFLDAQPLFVSGP